ncbi:hypothetical protein RhiirB3_389793 [Rhizophagus irregularis]|nr:hypothetical protein RhiirB3_389793 [Rhizophagus irregularis]
MHMTSKAADESHVAQFIQGLKKLQYNLDKLREGVKLYGFITNWIKGTVALVAATDFLASGNYDWDADFGVITGDWSHGFHLNIPDNKNITTYYLVFGVVSSTEEDKWCGSFDNNQDICWHFHNS